MSSACFFRRICQLKSQFSQAPELPFCEVLSEAAIRQALQDEGFLVRDDVYSPWVTLWLFLSQTISADPSCRDAVCRLLAFRAARGLSRCSTNTGAYCTARKRLPEGLLRRLVQQTGGQMHNEGLANWRWHGRAVKIVDGSTLSVPDTPQNADAFGKPTNQHDASGFPLVRLVCLLCLATGTVLQAAFGPYRGKKTGELSLFRQLDEALQTGDVILGDRLFCNYGDMARLAIRGVDLIFAHNGKRPLDFRRGQRLGKDDHLVIWHKPSQRPDGLTVEAFRGLPPQLVLREVRVRIARPGFRVRQLVVVTTLLDQNEFPPAEIAGLYRERWHAELDLRSIKCDMNMDVLRCQTPELIRKEIWVHLLAWNLLRSVLSLAAAERGVPVRELSFKAAQQTLRAFWIQLTTATPLELETLCTWLVEALVPHRVGQRPNRVEPRKRKRQPKPYPRLKLSREEERNLCRTNGL